MPLSTFLRDRPPQRGLIWLSLSETGRILKRSSASDGGGGVTETYSPAASADWAATTNVRCRIDALGGNEAEMAGRISDRSTHIITMAPHTAVSVDDDFQIQDRGRYEITAVRARTNEFARVIEVTNRT